MKAMPSAAAPLDRRLAVRAALTMAAVLAPVFLVLALTLPKSFFEDWGWLAGPGAWVAAALVAGRVCRLPAGPVLAGALVSGLVSLVFVLVDLHDVGPLFSLPLFGIWCGSVASRAVPAPVPRT
jgi:hypothetical protein